MRPARPPIKIHWQRRRPRNMGKIFERGKHYYLKYRATIVADIGHLRRRSESGPGPPPDVMVDRSHACSRAATWPGRRTCVRGTNDVKVARPAGLGACSIAAPGLGEGNSRERNIINLRY